MVSWKGSGEALVPNVVYFRGGSELRDAVSLPTQVASRGYSTPATTGTGAEPVKVVGWCAGGGLSRCTEWHLNSSACNLLLRLDCSSTSLTLESQDGFKN